MVEGLLTAGPTLSSFFTKIKSSCPSMSVHFLSRTLCSHYGLLDLQERFVSYLPLSHVAANIMDIFMVSVNIKFFVTIAFINNIIIILGITTNIILSLGITTNIVIPQVTQCLGTIYFANRDALKGTLVATLKVHS